MSWKQTLVCVCLVIWIATFLLGHNLDNSSVYKVPKPAYNPKFWSANQEIDNLTDKVTKIEPIVIESDVNNVIYDQKPEYSVRWEENARTTKKILYFTPYFHMKDFQFGFGHLPFIEKGCPVSNCYATNNRSLLKSINEFDAILYHIRDMHDGHLRLPNPKLRKPNQKYVMFLMESPLNDNFPYEKFRNFFNWTMTFRRDSDFYRPYGWIAPKNWDWHYAPREPIPWEEYMKQPPNADNADLFDDLSLEAIHDRIGQKSKKKVIAAWLVSNCHTHSQREQFVEDLQKHLEVDVYGSCGPHNCPQNDKCFEHIADNYMFYLSFENSVCSDYVTEKFFTPLTHNILPVVLGGANYSQIAPPHSHINARDFPSAKALADHLKYLLSNTTAYEEYFEWKKYFKVYGTLDFYMGRAMCQLCEVLNDESQSQKTKVYSDINHWWRDEAKCKIKGSFPWSKPEPPSLLSGLSSLSDFVVKQTADIIESLRDSKVVV